MLNIKDLKPKTPLMKVLPDGSQSPLAFDRTSTWLPEITGLDSSRLCLGPRPPNPVFREVVADPFLPP